MKSISVRLAIWYAFAATITLSCLFTAGYHLLERHLIQGLDLLNQTQYEQVKATLLKDIEHITPEMIEYRLRTNAESAAVLFYIEIHNAKTGTVFYSSNLKGLIIPDIPGERAFNSYVVGIGELRVAEYLLGPYDVTIATSLTQTRDVMDGYAKVCLILLGLMLLASLAIGYGLSRLALRPVRLISDTANRIRSDNMAERIPVSDVRDEVSDLAKMLNQMFDRLEASFNQVRRFTAEASHELKTPLSIIRLYSEKMLVEGGLSPSHEDAVHVQLEELARLNQIIEELLFLSRAEANAISLNVTSENPAGFLQNFSQDARVLADHAGRIFAYSHDGEGHAAFDEKRLRQVLLNLLTNALHVTPAGKRITLRSILEDGMWRITVEDEGPGLPEDQYERIFERFVSFKTPGSEHKGNGLGLAICRSIIGLHHGRIFALTGADGLGLQMRIEIPAQV